MFKDSFLKITVTSNLNIIEIFKNRWILKNLIVAYDSINIINEIGIHNFVKIVMYYKYLII